MRKTGLVIAGFDDGRGEPWAKEWGSLQKVEKARKQTFS